MSPSRLSGVPGGPARRHTGEMYWSAHLDDGCTIRIPSTSSMQPTQPSTGTGPGADVPTSSTTRRSRLTDILQSANPPASYRTRFRLFLEVVRENSGGARAAYRESLDGATARLNVFGTDYTTKIPPERIRRWREDLYKSALQNGVLPLLVSKIGNENVRHVLEGVTPVWERVKGRSEAPSATRPGEERHVREARVAGSSVRHGQELELPLSVAAGSAVSAPPSRSNAAGEKKPGAGLDILAHTAFTSKAETASAPETERQGHATSDPSDSRQESSNALDGSQSIPALFSAVAASSGAPAGVRSVTNESSRLQEGASHRQGKRPRSDSQGSLDWSPQR